MVYVTINFFLSLEQLKRLLCENFHWRESGSESNSGLKQILDGADYPEKDDGTSY